MIILIIIILIGAIAFLHITQKGLRFEEECVAKIQEQQFAGTKTHISMDEARLRLRLTVELINQQNQKLGHSLGFLTLKEARILAVKLHASHIETGLTIPQIIENMANALYKTKPAPFHSNPEHILNSEAKRESPMPPASRPQQFEFKYSGGNGSSQENAVIIHAASIMGNRRRGRDVVC
ncbi:hypothetical protein M2447_001890 [Ereboglobus sp. PH5-10]|uniref:hypothetical protein n=1 Tax=Ereboglobus sp. PH5-10 TaxID=2940629 RepID=UPI002406D1A7|nr:hypothetical protein [Ereboglobus sp. PH5-10]MDF9827788.1 hypothetical protein [Ereboglobus sp. PH5-10]